MAYLKFAFDFTLIDQIVYKLIHITQVVELFTLFNTSNLYLQVVKDTPIS